MPRRDPAGGRDVDVALVGGGGAAMTILLALAASGPPALRVAVIDPVDRLRDQPADRTWCFWSAGARADVAAGIGTQAPPRADPSLLVAEAVHRRWSRALLVDRDGTRHVLDLAPLNYAMVRSSELYALVAERTQHLHVVHVPEAALTVVDGGDGALVQTLPGRIIRSAYAFDSRPAPPARPARTALLQHFRGVVTRAAYDVFDPDVPTLMDFRTPQPENGLSFGYVLPSSARSALVEYTEFSPHLLTEEGYRGALASYLRLAAGRSWELGEVEHGVIPMTDAAFARRAGRFVYRVGTSGGATRAASGYTFAAMLRQAQTIAEALAAGRRPLPPRPYPRRHHYLDAVFLRALADGSLDGPAFFTQLFARNPAERVLRFLDGRAGWRNDARVVGSAPWGPMARAACRDAVDRMLVRRPASLG